MKNEKRNNRDILVTLTENSVTKEESCWRIKSQTIKQIREMKSVVMQWYLSKVINEERMDETEPDPR